MGAPKHKWTAEEEAALIAGIAKYGAGKWSKILKDPEFSDVLHMRSNVDLKDKWRNIHVAESGFGSRQKSRLAVKNIHPTPNHDDDSLVLSTVVDADIEIAEAKPLAIISDPLPNGGSKKPISRLDDHILESISNLKEPRGSNRTAIAMQIKEQYLAPPNLERLLSANLKLLTDNGKLTKVKHQYRIAPSSLTLGVKNDPPSLLLDEKKDIPRAEMSGIKLLSRADIVKHQYRIAPASPLLNVKMDTSSLLLDVKKDTFSLLLNEKKDPSALVLSGKKDSPKAVMNGIKVLTKADIDAELKKMMSMSAKEAAAAAEQAVAEAEAAIQMAEEAAREAEEAEREAEAAKGFLEETKKYLKYRKLCTW